MAVKMDAEQRKMQILECAKKIFSARGYYQTQISDIQHAAGVARGTIYQYFKNKDDIFSTLLENFYLDWKNVLTRKPEQSSELYNSGYGVFWFKIKKTFDFFADNPDYCKILLRVGLGIGDNFDRIISRFDKQMVELINEYLNSGIKLGRVKKEIDVELITNLISGAFMRMAYYYVIMKKRSGTVDTDELTNSFVTAVAYGIFAEKLDKKQFKK
jgi:AcrR family transcriptional regulator